VLALGTPVNGARRWLTFGPAVFQPSELAKLAVCVWGGRGGLLLIRECSEPMTIALPEGTRMVVIIGVFSFLAEQQPDSGLQVIITDYSDEPGTNVPGDDR